MLSATVLAAPSAQALPLVIAAWLTAGCWPRAPPALPDGRSRGNVPPHLVLRAIEQKIEALFEGVFGRAFRTNVQPVELARKIAKEMDDHRPSRSRGSTSRTSTPSLSTADREQFAGYEDSLLAELEEYVGEHAKRESYALLTPPKVLLETDDDLALGEFGIATRMVQPRRGRAAGAGSPQGRSSRARR